MEAPVPVQAALAAVATPEPGFVWTPPERLHLTLRFLGDTPASLLEPLRTALRPVGVAPFVLPVAGVGVFPPRGRPRVLWCGVGHGHPHLQQLRQRLDDGLLALGLPVDLRRFAPHFTLARFGAAVAPARTAAWLRRHRDFEAPPFRVDRFSLYASALRPAGPVHTLIESFPFDGARAGGSSRSPRSV